MDKDKMGTIQAETYNITQHMVQAQYVLSEYMASDAVIFLDTFDHTLAMVEKELETMRNRLEMLRNERKV